MLNTCKLIISQIARLICYYYRLCQDKDYEELERHMARLPKASLETSQQGPTNDVGFDKSFFFL